jgi:hypothetical protein
MNYSEWLQQKSCRHCGSSKLELTDVTSPAASVSCGECHSFLCTWRDFRKASSAQPPKRAIPRKKQRSDVLKVWSASRPVTVKR